MNEKENKLNKIVSLAKRRGFVYPGSDIHGGLAGFWDFGPYGVLLKQNILNLWWQMFVSAHDDMFGLDSALIMRREVWEESGHAEGFADPLVECKNCGSKFRGEDIGFEQGKTPDGKPILLSRFPTENKCPHCGVGIDRSTFKPPLQFNTMLKTSVGVGSSAHDTFLRPETAQGIFENFKNVVDSLHPKLPFGIAQIGKAFRNEISPRDFLFRTREFTQMEVEYFVREKEWKKHFKKWQKQIHEWNEALGLSTERVHEVEVPPEERAHYSKRTVDFEYDFPHGRGELYGLAYRGDFDLRSHSVSYTDENGVVFVPHVIEPSLGLERTILAVLSDAYTEDALGGEEETRVYLKLKPVLAPVKVAVFPLLRNKPELVEKAQKIYKSLRKKIPSAMWDDNGNIGKRYRRQDEIGTPYCVTIDFQTLEDDTVTLRDRDTGTQKRVEIKKLTAFFKNILSKVSL